MAQQLAIKIQDRFRGIAVGIPVIEMVSAAIVENAASDFDTMIIGVMVTRSTSEE